MSETQNYVLAEKDYVSGMRYKDIADKYNVSINTVKSWKKRYGWEREKGAHKIEKGCTQNIKKKTVVAEAVKHVIENNELTDKQRLFCVLYTKCFNATKAYQKAYGCDEYSARANGSRMLTFDNICDEIQRLKQNRLNREMLDESDIFQKYMDIAFADITDYVEFGQEEVPVMGMDGPVQIKDEDTGEKKTLMKRINTVRFKECAEVDGTLITEVKQGKDGASIKFADRMKALDWIANHMNLATDEQKARIEQMRANADRLKRDNKPEDEEGVEIINDAEKEAGADIGDCDTEVSEDIQQHED